MAAGTDDRDDANGKGAELDRAIRQCRERQERWREEGERPVYLNLAMIGALGWLIVVPALLGVLLGRWLDRLAGSGITLTAALLVVGVAFGFHLAWKRMHRP